MKIKVGDQIDTDGVHLLINAISAVSVSVQEVESGLVKEILISDLVRLPNVKPVARTVQATDSRDIAVLQYLDAATRADVEFWVGHLRQLDEMTQASTAPGPIDTKLAELAALGHPITDRTLRRKRDAYRKSGPAGLIDQRQHRAAGERRRIDDRVVAALAEVMDSQTNVSTGTRTRLIALTAQLLAQRLGVGAVELPAQRTMFRLIDDLDRGRLTTGSAKTRRSLANRPDRPFAAMGVSRPGEQVQIDSTPLDVLVRLDGGLVDRPELTIMLDVATRSIVSAVVRPGSTKSVDLVVVLARALVP